MVRKPHDCSAFADTSLHDPATERAATQTAPTGAPSTGKPWAWLVVGTLLVSLQIALAVSSMRGDSATDDEPAHIVSGYLKLTRGDVSFYDYNPPLGACLIALPLLVVQPRLPADWRSDPNPWRVGHKMLYDSGNDADAILFLCRLPTLVLFVALSLFSGTWAFRLTGRRVAAVIAYALTAFCPNLMAHGRLATIDVALTLAVVLSLSALLAWTKRPTVGRALLASVPVAAALLIKVSALALLPWMLCVVVLLAAARVPWVLWRRLALTGLTLVVSVLALMEATYLVIMRPWWMEANAPGLASSMLGRLAIPVLAYLRPLRQIGGFVAAGFEKPQYLFGSFSRTGWWYYYPVAFGLKTTLPALLLATLSLLLVFWRRGNVAGRGRLPFEAVAIALFVAIFMAAAMKSHLDLGLRYILPVYPLLYVLIAVVLSEAIHTAAEQERKALLASVMALLAWHAGECVATWPNYIGSFNELIGDRNEADAYLIDSNLDWGQDLKRLANWVDGHGIPSIRIDYFGGGRPSYYLGAKAIPWPAPRLQPLPRGYFAVSKHAYRVSYYYRDFGLDYGQYLARARKIATINGSIDVYEVP